MLSGLYPSSLIPNAEYLDQIRAIIASLWSRNIRTIVDLHQDILSPVFCGEGAPSWMINVSQLGSLRFPAPMTFQPSQTADPDPRTGAWAKPMATLCDDQTAFRPLGWFDYYMSDAVNKAFAQVYAGRTVGRLAVTDALTSRRRRCHARLSSTGATCRVRSLARPGYLRTNCSTSRTSATCGRTQGWLSSRVSRSV